MNIMMNNNIMNKWTNGVRTVDRALLSRALQLDFLYSHVLYSVSQAYPRPYFDLLSRGEAIRDKPAQYIRMGARVSVRVVPNMEALPCLQIVL